MALDNPSPYTAQILAELEVQNLVNYHTAVPDALFRAWLWKSHTIDSLKVLGERTTFYMSGKNLYSMNGIEYATSATFIDGSSNNLTDVGDISSISTLITLQLANNQIESFGNVDCLTNLTTVSIENNVLVNIGSLALLTNLVTINASGNLLVDIGSVNSLTKLTAFYFNSNQLGQSAIEGIINGLYGNRSVLGGLGCKVNLSSNPGSAAAAVSKSVEIAAMNSAGMVVTI